MNINNLNHGDHGILQSCITRIMEADTREEAVAGVLSVISSFTGKRREDLLEEAMRVVNNQF